MTLRVVPEGLAATSAAVEALTAQLAAAHAAAAPAITAVVPPAQQQRGRPPAARSAPPPLRSPPPGPREPLATSWLLLSFCLRFTNHQWAKPSLAPSTTDSATSGLTNCT